MPRLSVLFTAAALLAGCASFPELDAAVTPEARRADYPVLIPTAGVLIRREGARLTAADGEQLQARAANLQARARLLRGVVIDEETRLRLSGRLRRLGG